MSTVTSVALVLLAAIAGVSYYRSKRPPCPSDAEIAQILADVDSGKTSPSVATGIADGLAAHGCAAAATAIRAVAKLKTAVSCPTDAEIARWVQEIKKGDAEIAKVAKTIADLTASGCTAAAKALSDAKRDFRGVTRAGPLQELRASGNPSVGRHPLALAALQRPGR